MPEHPAAAAEFPSARSRSCPFAPPPALREAAAHRPLTRMRLWNGSTPWVITGHAAQRSLLSDPRVSTDEKRPDFPHISAASQAHAADRAPSIFNTDAAEHSRFRRMMTFPFTAKRVSALRPFIQRTTDELIDAMLAGPKPADLVSALALPLPSLMISELLGVPYADHEFFQRHSVLAIDRDATPEQSAAASGALQDYLADLITARVEEPGTGWVSDLAQRVTAGDVTVAEAAQLGMVLLIAGHETSANMIGIGTAKLLQDPAQLAVLRDAEDPKVVAGAVEELLRYLSVAHHGLRRVALEDIEVEGETIRAGEGIVLALPLGNWDSAAFAEPERLDLHRDARQHNAFGFGVHQCVGQQLARVELQVVFGTLYRRVPTLALAVDPAEIAFKFDKLVHGVESLPVTW
ncbi:cytochrome P450 [Saccharopolyspora gregorii]